MKLARILNDYAAGVLAQRSEDIPPMELGLEMADQLGSVDLKRGSSYDPGPHECKINLRDELAAPHHLWFRGYGNTRAEAIADAIREAMVYVEARHRGGTL